MKKLKELFRLFVATMRLQLSLRSDEVKNELREVVRSLYTDASSSSRQKLFIMTVGYSKAGKGTLVRNHSRLKHFFRVDSDRIHDTINQRFSFLQDDNTVKGKAYWQRQILTRIIRKDLLRKAFADGYAVVSDSANLRKEDRAQLLTQAKHYGYKTVIIWVVCSEETLLSRLQTADQENVRKNEKPAWEQLYWDIQKTRLAPPKETEADKVIVYNSETETPQQVRL